MALTFDDFETPEDVAATQAPRWLVRDLLRQNTLTLLAAEPYTGKTLLTLYLMLCMEFQRPVFDQLEVPFLNSGLMFFQDPPRWDVAAQLRKLARGMGLAVPESLGLMKSKFYKGPGFRITQPDSVQGLIAYIKSRLLSDDEEWPAFLIFDTLLTIHYQDENDNKIMGQVLDVIKRIRGETGCAVILTHHTPVTLQQPRTFLSRGAGTIVGGVDYVYELTRVRDALKLKCKKGRGNAGLNEIVLRIDNVPHPHPEGALTFAARQPVHLELLLKHLPSRRQDLLTIFRSSDILVAVPASKREKLLDNGLQVLRRAKAVERLADGTWIAKEPALQQLKAA